MRHTMTFWHSILTKRFRSLYTSVKASIKMDFDWKVEGPAKYDDEDGDFRPTSYEYPRPKIDHLDVPASLTDECLGHMYDAHELASSGWSTFVGEYCSDDDGDAANGRISPCTFARFAEGAGDKSLRLNYTRFKSPVEEQQVFEIPVCAIAIPHCERPTCCIAMLNTALEIPSAPRVSQHGQPSLPQVPPQAAAAGRA